MQGLHRTVLAGGSALSSCLLAPGCQVAEEIDRGSVQTLAFFAFFEESRPVEEIGPAPKNAKKSLKVVGTFGEFFVATTALMHFRAQSRRAEKAETTPTRPSCRPSS